MVKLNFLAHDYVEFKHRGKDYSIDLKNDKRYKPKLWQKEIVGIEKTPATKLLKKYKLKANKPLKDTRPHFMKNFFG